MGTRIDEQLARGDEDPDELPPSDGSEVAPTRRAVERERIRHALERDIGRRAAGLGDTNHQVRSPEATRERLDQVAEEADRLVAVEEVAGDEPQ